MTAFQIDLHELESGPVEKSFQPSREQLEELFEAVSDEFRVVDAEEFVADVRAQMADTTIHVAGHVRAQFAYDCGRCLAERRLDIDKDVDFVLMSEQEWSTAYADEDEIALSEEDMNVSYYEGDLVDLGSLIREAILLEFPGFPQCPDELRAECDELYEERVGAETLAELEEQKTDLRWSPLKKLTITEGGKVKKVDEEDTD